VAHWTVYPTKPRKTFSGNREYFTSTSAHFLASPDSTFTPLRTHGWNISESDAKQLDIEGVGVNKTPRQISDMVSSSADCHSVSEATTAQPEGVAATARALTFTELQTLVEQGKTDEIPNNKHIPDALNVGLNSYSVTW
jgi:hypothetical protein